MKNTHFVLLLSVFFTLGLFACGDSAEVSTVVEPTTEKISDSLNATDTASKSSDDAQEKTEKDVAGKTVSESKMQKKK